MFFKSLAPLLDEFESLQLKLERGPKGQLKVCVIPPSQKTGSRVSTVPLMLSATPEEFDEKFAQLLNAWTPAYRNLAEQAAANSQILAAPKGKQKGAIQNQPADNEDDESEDSASSSEQQNLPKRAAVPASDGTDLFSLLDDSQ